MLAVSVALIASACWGAADFIAGLSSRRLSALLVLLVQQAIGALLAAGVVLAITEGPPPGEAIVYSLLAGAAGALGLGAFYRALAIGRMSVVAPISATGVTLPVAVGLASGERIGAIVALGLVVAATGVVLASREVHDDAAAASVSRASIGFALVGALGMGSFFALADAAAEDSVLWLLIVGRTTAVVLLAAALVAVRRRPRLPGGREWGVLAGIGVLDVAATGLYALATTEGLLAIVSVVGSLYPVITVVLARLVLGERLQGVQLAGVILAFVGISAVAVGA